MIDSLVYFLQRRYSAARHLFRMRCTPAGQAAVICLAVSAALGLDTHRNQAHLVFSILLAVLLVVILSVWLGGRSIRWHFNARRALPRFGTVGEVLHYRVQLQAGAVSAMQGTELMEALPDPRPVAAVFRAARRQGENRHRRWQRLCRVATWFEAGAVALPENQGLIAEMQMELLPLRRGRLHLRALLVCRADPLGLLKGLRRIDCDDSVLILPRRYRLIELDLPGQRSMLQNSRSLSDSVADAEEFQSLRDYRPGDPLRLIHWKSWARSGRPVIREFQDEFSVRHALVLDTFDAGLNEAIFEEAVSLAASFACTVDTRDSLLDLLFVGASVYRETIGRGHGPVEHLLEVLAGVQPCVDKPFASLQAAVLAQRGELSACICILLAWDEARAAFIQSLDALGVPRMVWVVTDAKRSNLRIELPANIRVLEAGRVAEGLANP